MIGRLRRRRPVRRLRRERRALPRPPLRRSLRRRRAGWPRNPPGDRPLLKRDESPFNELVARVLSFDYLGALASPSSSRCCWRRIWGWCAPASSSACSTWRWRCGPWRSFREQARARIGFAGCRRGRGALPCGGLVGPPAQPRGRGLDATPTTSSTPRTRLPAHRGDALARRHPPLPQPELQFSSKDEYRYHEALVHPGLAGLAPCRACWCSAAATARGARNPQVSEHRDGHAGRSRPGDDAVVFLASLLRQLNGDALNSPKVTVINGRCRPAGFDDHGDTFDFNRDFPIPRIQHRQALLGAVLSACCGRISALACRLVVQATSPLLPRPSPFWTVVATLADAGLKTALCMRWLPSFGEWG